jgi:electron transfer flavoprotein beta subunit
MNVVVCVKQVPDTSDPDTEVHIDSSGKGVDQSKFSFVINDADNFAVEEAILLKEKHGGEVTVVNVGSEAANQVVRMALAKGGDSAIRLDDEKFAGSDPVALARILQAAIKDCACDIVMTGCLASDDGYGAVGVALAQLMGVPHAAYVKTVEVLGDNKLKIGRELEGGLLEMDEIDTPCVLTIQTGGNEPRYASFKGPGRRGGVRCGNGPVLGSRGRRARGDPRGRPRGDRWQARRHTEGKGAGINA